MTPNNMTIAQYHSFLGKKKDLLILKIISLFETFADPNGFVLSDMYCTSMLFSI